MEGYYIRSDGTCSIFLPESVLWNDNGWARDHVENGLTKTEAMARHGIASIASLERWCRDYRSGGAQAEARTDARAGARRTGRVPEGEGRVPGKLRALRASKSRGASEAPSSDCSQGGDTGSTTS